jgi:hypothetical protein
MLFITLALSSILIALIVIALKKHQQQRHKDLAEREQSLPPLDASSDFTVHTQPDSITEVPGHASDSVYDSASGPDTEQRDVDTFAEPRLEPVNEQTKDWKEECRQHRQAQRYEAALSCSDQAWPQSQSYEQAALTMRAAIKQEKDSGSPIPEEWLAALYRVAAECSLLYDKVPGQPDMRWQAIARAYSRQDIKQIDLPWSEIGADELKLLTKTDRKLMLDVWGEPKRHISAKSYQKLKKRT